MNKLFWLDEQQWANLEPLLPKTERGKRCADDRRAMSGIIHVMRSGCRWSEAPEAYGPSKTLYNRFVRWSLAGVWEEMFATLVAPGGPPADALPDPTHIKVHRSASCGKRRPSVDSVVQPEPAVNARVVRRFSN